MIENLRALLAHGPQFPGTLDLTGSSDVVVLELRHNRWIRRRWRPSEPLRLPRQHRPLHVQTRLAQSPAQPLGTSAPRFDVLNSPCGPNYCSFNGLRGGPGLLSLVLGPFKGLSADWNPSTACPQVPTSAKRRLHFSHAAVCVLEFGNMKDPLTSKTTMLPMSITPDTACKGFRTLDPWDVTRLEMSPPTVSFGANFYCQFSQIVYLFTSEAHVLCPFTEHFDGFKSTYGQSSGFRTDSPATESTVSSRYRPRMPSVSPVLLSIVMLPIVTAFRSTLSRHLSPSLELSLGRSAPSLEMSYCGAFVGRRWYTPASDTQDKQGNSLKGNFHIGYRLRCVSCPRIHLLQSVELFLLPIPTHVFRNFPQNISVFLNQESSGNGKIISVVSSVDSSTSTSPPWSDNTSKDPTSMVTNGTFCEVSVSSPQFPTPFPLGADFGSLPLTGVLAL